MRGPRLALLGGGDSGCRNGYHFFNSTEMPDRVYRGILEHPEEPNIAHTAGADAFIVSSFDLCVRSEPALPTHSKSPASEYAALENNHIRHSWGSTGVAL